MSASRRKVPVTILTGFLGSGKTTLLNHILEDPNHKLRFAIIENEFGEVGVDEKILSEKTDEEIIEVMNGCICCTVRGDLVVALKNLYAKIAKFDAVIIETTGLADPAPVAQTFFIDSDITGMYSLDGIITVVDAKHIIMRLDDEKPEGVENEAVEQVAFADRILLNKTDLVEEEDLPPIEDRLKKINPTALVYPCQNSMVDPQNLIGISAFSLDRVMEMDGEFLNTEGEHEHDPSVVSTSCRLPGYLSLGKLGPWIEEIVQTMGANLYRYKGVLAVAGKQQKYVFQGVGMLYTGTFKTEWKQDEVRECRFVFIGKHLDKEHLLRGFRDCHLSELRFQVGDKVMAKIGDDSEENEGWARGIILQHWEDDNPYSIDIPDEGCGVCAPEDEDEWVRQGWDW